MATGVHESDRGAYPLGRYRGVGTAARAESVALPASPAAGKESTHGTTETYPSGQRTHARSSPHDGRAGESYAGRTARGESPHPPRRASSAGTVELGGGAQSVGEGPQGPDRHANRAGSDRAIGTPENSAVNAECVTGLARWGGVTDTGAMTGGPDPMRGQRETRRAQGPCGAPRPRSAHAVGILLRPPR